MDISLPIKNPINHFHQYKKYFLGIKSKQENYAITKLNKKGVTSLHFFLKHGITLKSFLGFIPELFLCGLCMSFFVYDGIQEQCALSEIQAKQKGQDYYIWEDKCRLQFMINAEP